MRIFRKVIAAAAVAGFGLLATSQARADFSGFYVGAQIGYGQTMIDESATVGGASYSASPDDTGFNYGGLVGYGRQFSNFYLGGELDVSWSTAETQQSGNGVTLTIEQGYTLGAALRAGYVVTPSTLIYLRAGIVQTEFDATATDGASTVSGSETFNGFRFGVGLDYMFNANVGMRLEYTHTNYEDKSETSGADSVSLGGDEDIVKVALTYKF